MRGEEKEDEDRERDVISHHYPSIYLLCAKFKLLELLLIDKLVKLRLMEVHGGADQIGIVCGREFLKSETTRL